LKISATGFATLPSEEEDVAIAVPSPYPMGGEGKDERPVHGGLRFNQRPEFGIKKAIKSQVAHQPCCGVETDRSRGTVRPFETGVTPGLPLLVTLVRGA